MSAALHHLTVGEAGRRVAAGAVRPSALVEAVLARIDAVDGQVHSYITVAAQRARTAAAAADREIAAGRRRGPLHGIPFAVKDNYHVNGLATTAASRLMLDRIADATSTAVARLEAAGAILLGKLNTWELGTGTGAVRADLPFEVARNPWDLARVTGGSSTGPAASVAAGTALFALGSDTGGSIRLPAAACGLVGLKPTYGLVSRAGCLPNCWSLDHNGPLTWTVEDAAIVLGALVGHDPDDPASFVPANAVPADYLSRLHEGVRGLTIGIVRDLGSEAEALDPAEARACDEVAAVLADLGATIREVRLPAALTEYRHVNRIINWAESYAAHEDEYRHRRHLMGAALREKMLCGSLVRAVDYLAALRRRTALTAAMDATIRGYDAIVLPGAFHLPPRFDAPETIPAYTTDNACSAFNLTGHPALVVPSGFAGDLPLSTQIVGRAFEEATILRVAQAYESATDWRSRRPVLPVGGAVRSPGRSTAAATREPEAGDVDARAAAARVEAHVASLVRPLPEALEPAHVYRVPWRINGELP